MKKIILAVSTALLLLGLCSCGTGDEVTPSDSADMRTIAPTLSGTNTLAPTASDSPAPIQSFFEDVGDGIKNFAEGTVEAIEDLPEIVKAVTDKYNGSEVTGITHAMHMNKQVYEVKYTDKDGNTKTAYVSPDGKTVTEAAEPNNSPDASASPSTSPTSGN